MAVADKVVSDTPAVDPEEAGYSWLLILSQVFSTVAIGVGGALYYQTAVKAKTHKATLLSRRWQKTQTTKDTNDSAGSAFLFYQHVSGCSSFLSLLLSHGSIP